VNSVDNVNIVNIGMALLVVECGHCPGARAVWWDAKPGEPPDLWFQNFPNTGRMMLSNKTILLACDRCKGQLDTIRKDYGNVLEL